MRSTAALFAVLSIGLVRGTSVSHAQTLSTQQRQDILAYQLDLPRANHLIIAMQAMTRYMVSLPDFQERLVKSMKMTPAERRAQMEKDPKAMAILKENGLTPPEYLTGVPALRMALLTAQGTGGPNIVASPGNTAFAKANLAELKPKMDAADGVSPR